LEAAKIAPGDASAAFSVVVLTPALPKDIYYVAQLASPAASVDDQAPPPAAGYSENPGG